MQYSARTKHLHIQMHYIHAIIMHAATATLRLTCEVIWLAVVSKASVNYHSHFVLQCDFLPLLHSDALHNHILLLWTSQCIQILSPYTYSHFFYSDCHHLYDMYEGVVGGEASNAVPSSRDGARWIAVFSVSLSYDVGNIIWLLLRPCSHSATFPNQKIKWYK